MYGVGGWDKEIYMTLKEKNIRMKRKTMWATGLYKANDNGPGPTHGIVAIAMINCHNRSTWPGPMVAIAMINCHGRS